MEPIAPKRNWTRFANQLGLGTFIAGVAAGLIKAWITFWLGPGAHFRPSQPTPPPVIATDSAAATTAPEPQSIAALLKTSPISLVDWQQRVEQRYPDMVSRERAFREFSGRDVVWEAYFSAVHPVSEGATSERAYSVVLYESRTTIFAERPLLGPPFIRCLFPESAGPQLQKLKPGDWVVVRGRLSNPVLTGTVLCTDLEPVTLVAAERVRNVDLALEPTATVR